MQKQNDVLHVIAYASRTLRPSERNDSNYSSAKLELLAVKWAVTEKFRDYLLGSKFKIITDNNPVSYLQNQCKAGSCEAKMGCPIGSIQLHHRISLLKTESGCRCFIKVAKDHNRISTYTPSDRLSERYNIARGRSGQTTEHMWTRHTLCFLWSN